jgi:hypothetical protein
MCCLSVIEIQFPLEDPKETLRACVVPTAALGGYPASKLVLDEQIR